MGHMPVGFGNGLGLEHVFLGHIGIVAARDVDYAVNIDPAHMNALRAKVARQRLHQSAQGELGRTEGH